jgi:hypothetical protein
MAVIGVGKIFERVGHAWQEKDVRSNKKVINAASGIFPHDKWMPRGCVAVGEIRGMIDSEAWRNPVYDFNLKPKNLARRMLFIFCRDTLGGPTEMPQG